MSCMKNTGCPSHDSRRFRPMRDSTPHMTAFSRPSFLSLSFGWWASAQ